jgi:hypothetical protein
MMVVTRRKLLLFLFCILSLSVPQCQAVAKADYKSIDQNDQGSPFVRLIMDSFEIELSPTVSALTTSDESLFRREAEKAIRAYLAGHRGQDFEYALLADIEDNVFESGPSRRMEVIVGSTTLRFKGGVAAFRSMKSSPVPTVTELNGWVKAALEEDLLARLAKTNLRNVTNATYTSLVDPPTQAPSQLPTSYTQVSSVIESNNKTSDHRKRLKAGVLVSILAVVGVALAAFLVIRKRQRVKTTAITNSDETVVDNYRTNDLEHSIPYEDDQANNSLATAESQCAPPNHDSASLDDSDWTFSTNTPSHTTIMPTESFERDRQFLTKDMLQADIWTAPLNHGTVHQQEVLVIAKSTKASKRSMSSLPIPRNQCDESDLTPCTMWTPVDNDAGPSTMTNESPFLFESEGEDVYLMPPSQSSRQRVVPYGTSNSTTTNVRKT